MKLSFDDWWAGNGIPVVGSNKLLVESYREWAKNAWDASLAQQAQADSFVRMDPVGPPSITTTGPDYRCVMCGKPIPVGCKDCTEYALESVGARQAQPEPQPAWHDVERYGPLLDAQHSEPWREPTLEEARGCGPNLLDFDFDASKPTCDGADCGDSPCDCH